MHKLSIPISMNILTEETMPQVLAQLRACKAQRVFLTILEAVYSPDASLYTAPERIESAIRFFKAGGLEVGVWMNAFGHGSALSYQADAGDQLRFTPIEGVNGDKYSEGYCPLDENFAAHYAKAVSTVARMHPDLIMLDDDYRLNTRLYYMGCFCPLHLKEFYKRVGEKVPRDKLETLIFTGGKNKYRTAYMELYAETMLNFSRMLREAVNREDPNVRLGFAMCNENWDYCGTDAIAITKALAGDTAPFLRINGAPYWGGSIIEVIEDSRLEFQWCKGSGVEVFAEGDTYPRPRYKVSAKVLELFDMALLCDGTGDGILKYMYDYTHALSYETGYVDRHMHNASLRNQLKVLFAGKEPVGVYSFNALHKIQNWVLPPVCPEKVANKLMESSRSCTRHILSQSSIPTAYTPGEYPVCLFGENARYVTKEDLKNGAILDVSAARILMEAGIDTGLLSSRPSEDYGEAFLQSRDEVYNVNNGALKTIQCCKKAKVLSRWVPGDSPASYTYENGEGLRFLVLATDVYFAAINPVYANNYYRQAQLVEAVQWMCGKALPAVCLKNPNLYILTSRGDGEQAVLLMNICQDEILEPVVMLDKPYSHIRFVNCTGKLVGDRVFLSELGPYGVAAFAVQ